MRVWKVDPKHKTHQLLAMFPAGGWLGVLSARDLEAANRIGFNAAREQDEALKAAREGNGGNGGGSGAPV